jgi:outer membrane protein OmpA-like peptidoglycan-associated protein
MYKGFDINYIGTEGLTSGEMQWILDNYKNKDGIDRTNMMPVSAGAGLNMWLNDRFGFGMQADYVVMPYEDVANSLQGTVRLMWRIGGKTKKAAPVYRERIVERIVERVVEKPVIETVEVVKRDTLLSGLFQNINFEFDKSVLTPSSYDVIDKIARILKKDPDKRFLITGYTDAKGTPEYNLSLSKNRAETVVNALIDKGVPEYMLKPRGVGMKISYANSNASDDIREADRKVTIEIISNAGYWDYIQSK